MQLDRHHRALLVDGGVYQGSGWYVEGGDFIRNFTTAIDRMSQHGYNMVMTYRFRKAVVADTAEVVPTPAELAAFLEHCESVGMFVIFDFMYDEPGVGNHSASTCPHPRCAGGCWRTTPSAKPGWRKAATSRRRRAPSSRW